MTIKQLQDLKIGDQVYKNLGNGFIQIMTFKKIVTVTTYGKMTVSDLMKSKIDFSNGKQELNAVCEYIDERGKTHETYINPRKLHKYTF